MIKTLQRMNNYSIIIAVITCFLLVSGSVGAQDVKNPDKTTTTDMGKVINPEVKPIPTTQQRSTGFRGPSQAFRKGTGAVNIGKRFNNFRRGTAGVRLSSFENFQKTVEVGVKIDNLKIIESELPSDLIFSRVPKFPMNPAVLREARDLKRLVREAFDQELYWRNWDGVAFSLMTDGLNEAISYYVIALQFKGTAITETMKQEIENLRKFLERIVGKEFVIHEKFPYVIVIASDMQGDDQFTNVKKLGKIMKSKLFPEELQKTPDTKEVTLEKATEELVKPGKAGENPGLE